MILLFIIAVIQIQLIILFRRRATTSVDNPLAIKFEASQEKVIELYHNLNMKLEEEKQALLEEKESILVAAGFAEAEEHDEDDEVEETVSVVTDISSVRLFKKIEAARKLVAKKKNFIPDEVSAQLIELLTPESDCEAA